MGPQSLPRRAWLFTLLALLLGLAPLTAKAQEGATALVQPSRGVPGALLVDLPTRPQARVRFLLLGPAQPAAASLVLMVGGDGRLDLTPDTVVRLDRGNFLKRCLLLWVAQGFRVALVDQAQDHSSPLGGPPPRSSREHAQDLGAVLAYLRAQSPAPVWLVGTSRGTISAANAAARLGQAGPDGLVLSSSILGGHTNEAGVFALDLGAIRQPVLLVHHRQDQCPLCPFAELPSLVRALSQARPVEVLSYEGGRSPASGPCEALSEHGYYGIEEQVVEGVSRWIRVHNPAAGEQPGQDR